MPIDIKNKKVLVTGGTKGIGKALVEQLLAAEAQVAIAARHIPATMNPALKTYSLDLAEVATVGTKIVKIIDDLEGVDILVNNAGIAYNAPILDTPLADWQQVLNVNLTSVFECIRAVLPTMRSQQQGMIINVASIAGKQAFPTWGAYSASKFGLLGLTQALAAEEQAHGIRVMAICPGSVDTPIWDTLPTEVATNFDRSAMLTAETVAEMIMAMIQLSTGAVIQELVLMPNAGIL